MKKVFDALFNGSALLTFKFAIYLFLAGTFYSFYKVGGCQWAKAPAMMLLGMATISFLATAIFPLIAWIIKKTKK